ncbi:MAG: hypothetical protein KKA05_04600 [Alphaproteobacteria bacterium]|nr:hypothetical protein [Alphaproteobacteria bacterium]
MKRSALAAVALALSLNTAAAQDTVPAAPADPATTTTAPVPVLPFVAMAGGCSRPSDRIPQRRPDHKFGDEPDYIPVITILEVLRVPQENGPELTQIWMGRHGFIHIFERLLPRGTVPGADGIIRGPLGTTGIDLAYDTANRIGRATMTSENFKDTFMNHATSDNRFNGNWRCNFFEAPRLRLVPPSLRPPGL